PTHIICSQTVTQPKTPPDQTTSTSEIFPPSSNLTNSFLVRPLLHPLSSFVACLPFAFLLLANSSLALFFFFFFFLSFWRSTSWSSK
ncbi:unnamed protein product, partial [Tetraodon nigroviridis]